MGYSAVAIFIRLAVVASQICEILRKFELTAVQGYSRSSILVSIERACNFLLVINSNFVCISYRFRDIDAFSSKIAFFLASPLIDVPIGKHPAISR